MKKSKTWASAFLLLAVLPFQLVARDQASEVPEKGPSRLFSLSICGDRSSPPARTPAGMPILLRLNLGEFSLRSISRDFLKDAGQIWSYPVHIRTRDILPIAGLAALTGFLIGNDEAIHRGFIKYRDAHAWVRGVSPVVTRMGTYGAWGTVAVFLGAGLIGGDKKSTETAVLASSAMLQSGILVTFLKGIFGRQRPFWADGVDHWSGPAGFFERFESGQRGRYDSFPGGHSITAFSLATVVAMQYRKSVWVPILAYATATGVALSRVTENKHWLSDSLVGSVLGYVIGRLVVRNHLSRHHVTPAASDALGSLPFAVTFSF
ncbi:MAG: phosphatase PAP2 family protein [Candidatus Aminicenantes bacterium]|nr:phosphatase PAP2 family protein [Candidatus Aminicenantes bacterium]